MNVTKDERLAMLVAMDKQISPALKAAKEEARMELMDGFADTHADRRAIVAGGSKVGEIGISYTTPKPVIKAERMGEALAALRDMGLTEEVPAKGWEKAFSFIGGNVVNAETGEAADWAYMQGRTAKTAVVRGCKPEDVVAAMGTRISEIGISGLLSEGVE